MHGRVSSWLALWLPEGLWTLQSKAQARANRSPTLTPERSGFRVGSCQSFSSYPKPTCQDHGTVAIRSSPRNYSPSTCLQHSHMVMGLNCCSQNGRNPFRDPYHNLDHTIGTRVIPFEKPSPQERNSGPSLRNNLLRPAGRLRNFDHSPDGR